MPNRATVHDTEFHVRAIERDGYTIVRNVIAPELVDALSTMVTDGTMLKVYAWYDNEVGYACRMVDLANIVITRSQ